MQAGTQLISERGRNNRLAEENYWLKVARLQAKQAVRLFRLM
jgi:hypothetical protein